jgi:hypothetical protein
MKSKHLETKKQELVARREQLIGRFNESARAGKCTTRFTTEIRRVNDFLATLDRVAAENSPSTNAPRRYAVSSLFLHDCFRKLTADPDEQFFFITGAEVGGVHVLDQCAEFAHQRRTRLGVVADMPSMHRLLIKLEQFGHKFLAHFHSHPGNGPEATHSSGTDEDFQRRLEQGGHLALMAIFSRDGYVRFRRLDRNFELEIYGEGVEAHAPFVYRLRNLD